LAEGNSLNQELVMFYVDSLLDVMDTSTLYLHQHQLLGESVCHLVCQWVTHSVSLWVTQ